MPPLLSLHALAEARGEGLTPEMLALLRRAASQADLVDEVALALQSPAISGGNFPALNMTGSLTSDSAS